MSRACSHVTALNSSSKERWLGMAEYNFNEAEVRRRTLAENPDWLPSLRRSVEEKEFWMWYSLVHAYAPD